MSRGAPLLDEPFAELRADSTLRRLAERDSLEPSRALDRAVLAAARSSVRGTPEAVTRRRAHRAQALRWGIPAALAAATVCAIVGHRPAARSGTARGADQRVFELMQVAPIGALEMVSVSARYRGAGSRASTSAASMQAAPRAARKSQHATPELIWVSTPSFRMSTARKPTLIDSIDSLDAVRLTLQPSPAQQHVPGSSGRSAGINAPVLPRVVPAEARANPPNR